MSKCWIASVLFACVSLCFSSPREHGARELPKMHSARAAHTSTLLEDGMVLIVGGFVGDEHQIAGVELYDPEQGRFLSTNDALMPRQSHTATRLPNGRVLIVGGYGANGRLLDSAEIFDPISRTFVAAGRMAIPRTEHTAVVLPDQRIAFIGGKSDGWKILDTIEIFDPRTETFEQAGRMLVPRTSNVSVLLSDGRVLIAGGSTGRGPSLRIYDSAEIFDPRSDKAVIVGNMNSPRHKHDAVLLADGRVLLTGGASDNGRNIYDSAEIFDPSRDTFTPASKMKLARYKHRGASLLLSNGSVLIAGGAQQPEVYDPARNEFDLIETSEPLHARFSSVSRLSETSVLVTGGYYRPDSPTSAAWLIRR